MPVEAILAIREVITMAIAGVTVALVAYSPVFRALGNRIMHGRTLPPGAPADAGRVDDLSDEMAALRQALHETQDRLEFTERMLAQAQQRGALSPPRTG